jgi:membrane-associated phospholipid phosphatase
MPRTALHETIDRLDRELGARLRDRVAARPRVARALAIAADVMSPAYRVIVVVLILWRPTRMRGVRALIAAASAALIAKRMRDAIDRPRPGLRAEGGLPSRHAAAAVAIAGIVAERRRALGLPMAAITAVGLTGRISSGDHDPVDVVAGALLGGIVARVVGRLGRSRSAERAADDPGQPAPRG